MRVVSVNVAQAQTMVIAGRPILSAINKQPVEGRVVVRRLGLEGDEQADLSVHGGMTKAVYAYPAEHYAFWRTVRAQAQVAAWDDALPPGSIGENLTIEGLLEDAMWIGDLWRLPDCVLAVSEPRMPCFKFGAAIGFAQAVNLMSKSAWCGAYLGVIETGTIGAGDAIELLPGPREVNLRDLFRSRMRRG
jgi:MOSC domain-containing protein YiiM